MTGPFPDNFQDNSANDSPVFYDVLVLLFLCGTLTHQFALCDVMSYSAAVKMFFSSFSSLVLKLLWLAGCSPENGHKSSCTNLLLLGQGQSIQVIRPELHEPHVVGMRDFCDDVCFGE